LTPIVSKENLIQALREGPYGRCVYECDNDVVDHQVVNMSFEGGETATFTMTAFAKGGRKIRIFGTKGEISGDGSVLKIFDFLTEKTKTIDTNASDGTILGGHGGGDYGVMKNFVNAVSKNNPKLIISGPEESLESHLMVFAAEKARKENIVVNL
jgi:predicted dehydrogenase